jgi:hypothetical protein
VWKSVIQTLYLDLSQRGAFDLPTLLKVGDLTMNQQPCGKITLTSHPRFKDTWQLSTAELLVNLLDPHNENKLR